MDKSNLLQEAVDEMNYFDSYHRFFCCDRYKNDSCDRSGYIYCNNFIWHNITPSKKKEK